MKKENYMKKQGFTLAEVLITLGIIGVIAALTLPSLTSNVQKAHTGPALAKAINTLENANRNAMVHYNARSLKSIIANNALDPKSYIGLLNEIVSGAVDATDTSNKTFISKDGISYKLIKDDGKVVETPAAEGKDAVYKSPTFKYNYEYYEVLIDINAGKTPNKGGEDQFYVYVDHAGAVIPGGGSEAVKYGVTTKLTTGIKADSTYQNIASCADAPSKYCTGVVAENGWKVDY